MRVTGWFRSLRVLLIAGLAFAAAGALMPAEARLSDPGVGGPMSGGFFQGLAVGPEARNRRSDSEMTGVAGTDCYVRQQVVRDRLGASVLRKVRICE